MAKHQGEEMKVNVEGGAQKLGTPRSLGYIRRGGIASLLPSSYPHKDTNKLIS